MQSVLVLTPVKNAAMYLDGYFRRLRELTYPKDRLSVALLDSDSKDGTFDLLSSLADVHRTAFRNLEIFKHDFGFAPPEHLPRWEPAYQLARRNILARSRNQLLFRALRDENWVLWMDVDIISYPPDLIEQLLSYDLDILHPDCVRQPGGQSFDLNAWTDGGRRLMQDLRGSGKPVRIESVGGTVLLVRADLHRDGLVFPPFRYGLESEFVKRQHPIWEKGEIETEGLAAMAHEMGAQCWGLPDLEVIHA
jgi:glycosyltransferase involved in cell wall biosynthesis